VFLNRKFRIGVLMVFFIMLPYFTEAQSTVCHIQNTERFLKNIHSPGEKTIDFQLSGLNDNVAVRGFIQKASAAGQIHHVKVARLHKGQRKVTVTIDELGGLNSFRLMLMAASVQTLTTPDKTFDVIHLSVKKYNPFE